MLPIEKRMKRVFVGNSLTEAFPLQEIVPDHSHQKTGVLAAIQSKEHPNKEFKQLLNAYS
jgi:hypothetical protein